MKTLPDYLRMDLDILSVGLNPSVNSVRGGFYFATPQNRFWRALNDSGIISVQLEPSKESMDVLYNQYAIGFTDVVKRPTPGLSDLSAADFKIWAPILRDKIVEYRPRITWFHGKVAFEKFLRYGEKKPAQVSWGRQRQRPGGSIAFVTPNTSPANAAFSLADITAWYKKLACLQRRLESGDASRPWPRDRASDL